MTRRIALGIVLTVTPILGGLAFTAGDRLAKPSKPCLAETNEGFTVRLTTCDYIPKGWHRLDTLEVHR